MRIPAFYRFFRDPMHRQKREFLAGLPIFHGLHQNDYRHVLHMLEERVYIKDETMFCEGDIGRALFIVAEGEVCLTRKGPDGTEQPLARVHPGEIFGEMALLEEMPRTAGAKAAEKTRVYMLYKNRLENLLSTQPKIGVVIVHYLARILSARLRSIMEQEQASARQP